jgi:hypothetical protein
LVHAIASCFEQDARLRHLVDQLPHIDHFLLGGRETLCCRRSVQTQKSHRLFESLEQACAVRDVHLIYVLADPKWDPFRNDGRFEEVLRRGGLVGAKPQRRR